MSKIALLDMMINIWKVIGFNLFKTTKLMNLMTFVIFVLLIVTCVLGLIKPILEEINTNSLADAFEICGPYYQVS